MNAIFSSLKPKVVSAENESKSSSKQSKNSKGCHKLKLPKENVLTTDLNSENFYRTPSQHITPIIFDSEFNSAVKKLGFMNKFKNTVVVEEISEKTDSK